MTPISVVAYLALFVAVGLIFLFVNLTIGKFLRPKLPFGEKLEVYECGEPTIGSSFVQFDLRFYVVALLFIIFDVEVAFFFPWATVFGKSTHLMDPRVDKVAMVATEDGTEVAALTDNARARFAEMGVPEAAMPVPDATMSATANSQAIEETASTIARMSMMDILVFFAVLMVGFAYVWKRGDLDWVRAVSQERAAAAERPRSDFVADPGRGRSEREPVLSS